jgi:hypothetical protein
LLYLEAGQDKVGYSQNPRVFILAALGQLASLRKLSKAKQPYKVRQLALSVVKLNSSCSKAIAYAKLSLAVDFINMSNLF